jgi:hypothetical protein
MKHLNEEELIEHYYKADASSAKHLARCAECAQAYAALQSDLAALQFPAPPARDVAYGEQVWASISSSLLRYEPHKKSWLHGGLWRGLSYASSGALLLACAFYAGRIWEHKQPQTTVAANSAPVQQMAVPPAPPSPPQPQPATPQPRQLVVVVLGDHLDRSEQLLVELKHADASNAELISPLRDEARSLLSANRLCRRKARNSDDPALAAALDRLDSLLTELANQKEELDAAAITRLQDEMNADGLLFEVRVLRSRIPDPPPGSRHFKGGTI